MSEDDYLDSLDDIQATVAEPASGSEPPSGAAVSALALTSAAPSLNQPPPIMGLPELSVGRVVDMVA